jgi:hypothetical protein
MIMKNKINKLFLCAIAVTTIVSCSKDDDALENVRVQKPLVSVDKKSVTAVEGEEITFTLTIDRPIVSSADLKLEYIVEGSSASFRDYNTSGRETTLADDGGFGKGSIGHVISFPARSKTATFTISLDDDIFAEATETIKIRLNSTGNGLAIVSPDSEIITITVTNKTSGDFRVITDWAGNKADSFGTIVPGSFKDTAGASHDYADLDFDFYIHPEDMFTPGQPDLNELIGGYDGATSNLPEVSKIKATDPDGIYYVTVQYYGGIAAPSNASIPLVVTGGKVGVFSKDIMLPNLFRTNGSAPSSEEVVAIVEKVGTTYTFKNAGGTLLGSGRNSNPRKK